MSIKSPAPKRALSPSKKDDFLNSKWSNHVWNSYTVIGDLSRHNHTYTVEGLSKETHRSHRELLCFHCPYYRATLKGSFVEAGSKTLTVDTTHHTLSLAIGWLYTGQINWSGDTDTEPYVSLYAFADSLNILALRRSTMSAIITFCRQGYHLAWTDAELAYSTLPHNSPLIRWLVDDRVNYWHPESVVPEPDYFQHAPLEFLFEVMAGLARREGVFLDCEVCGCCNDFCAYHEHESLEERLATCGTGGGDDVDADAEVQEKD